MKKKITKLGVMLLAVIMLLSTIPVSAANPEISPLRYDNISSMLVSLVISDKGLASCDGQITLRGGASVDMSLTLQKSKNQTNWSDEKTWTPVARMLFRSTKIILWFPVTITESS